VIVVDIYSDGQRWSPAEVAALLADLGLTLSTSPEPVDDLAMALWTDRPEWMVEAMTLAGGVLRVDFVSVPVGGEP
jgi:hypothetical protein